jgi:hypothetical protein
VRIAAPVAGPQHCVRVLCVRKALKPAQMALPTLGLRVSPASVKVNEFSGPSVEMMFLESNHPQQGRIWVTPEGTSSNVASTSGWKNIYLSALPESRRDGYISSVVAVALMQGQLRQLTRMEMRRRHNDPDELETLHRKPRFCTDSH